MPTPISRKKDTTFINIDALKARDRRLLAIVRALIKRVELLEQRVLRRPGGQ